MQLLTKGLREKFNKQGNTRNKDPKEIKIIVKFFAPTTSWAWYAFEYDGCDTFYGLVDGFEKNWDSFH